MLYIKSLKISKGRPETVNRRKTEKTTTKGEKQRSKGKKQKDKQYYTKRYSETK